MTNVSEYNLSSSLEDYLEAIFNLCRRQEVARSKEIAGLLGVAKPSVTGALKLLAKKGLVNYRPYGYVTLTEAGRRMAEKVVHRHDVLKAFFVEILGVEEASAQQAACRAEHALGPEIVRKLRDLKEYLSSNREQIPLFRDGFHNFTQQQHGKQGME